MAKLIIYEFANEVYVVLPEYEETFKELYLKNYTADDYDRSEERGDFVIVSPRLRVR